MFVFFPPPGVFTLIKTKYKTEEVEVNEHTLVLNTEKKTQESRMCRVKRTDNIYDKVSETEN